MSKSFDMIMKEIEEQGAIDDKKAKEIIDEHGALAGDEKKQVAAAMKMHKALKEDKDKKGNDEKKDDGDEASMDDYLQALSVLDSEDATEEDKKKAKAAKDKFEG